MTGEEIDPAAIRCRDSGIAFAASIAAAALTNTDHCRAVSLVLYSLRKIRELDEIPAKLTNRI
jgi:hypothetical protein